MWTLPTSFLWSPGTGLSGDVPQYHELRPAWLLLCRFALWIDSCLHPGAGALCFMLRVYIIYSSCFLRHFVVYFSYCSSLM